jgi:2,5-dihydroxypyridine 5,6-dioxygenase
MRDSLSDQQITQLFIDEFKLCQVREGENAVILSDPRSQSGYVAAAWAALGALGANCFEISLPPYQVSLIPNPTSLQRRKQPFIPSLLVTDLLKKVPMVVDLTAEGIIHAPEKEEILKSGARILTIKEPPSILRRMVPSGDLKRRVLAAKARLERANEMRVTSGAGTDFRAGVKESPIVIQYGFADEPGRWDHWPSGFIACYARDRTAKGRIVMDQGDILLPPNKYVESPITLEIDGGYIRKILGGFDAEYLRGYMESWNDPEAFAVSHVGWGLDKTGQWSALALERETIGMDARSFAGNFMWSNGTNRFAGRFSACHFDFPMRACTVELDGETIVTEGQIVPEDQR